MPDYAWGIPAAQIVIIGMFFYLWAALYAQYLTVVNKPWTYFKILLTAVIINALLNISFINMGLHIEGVALGTTITYIIYPMLLMWCCFKDMGEKTVKAVVLVMIPFLIMIVFILVINQLEFYLISKVFIYVVLYMLFLVLSSFQISIWITLE